MSSRGNSVLVVGPGSPLLLALPERLPGSGTRLLKVSNLESAYKAIKKRGLELVVLCLDVLKGDGLKLLRYIKDKRPALDVVLVNHPKAIQFSIEGMRLGAVADFILPLDVNEFIGNLKEIITKRLELRPMIESIERSFAAAAFLEAGEREAAEEILGPRPKSTG
jgi:DNA-binding NtrC family response regulator